MGMRIIKLSLPTSHVLHGPTVSLEGRQLVVRYDSDLGAGGEWAEIRFEDVVRLCYRDFSICGDDDIMGHDYFVEETDSTELRALREKRSAFLGPNQFEQEKDAKAPMKLYRLYFDDAAAIDVVARSFETAFALPNNASPTA